jgi:hypothetical protein
MAFASLRRSYVSVLARSPSRPGQRSTTVAAAISAGAFRLSALWQI